MERIRAALRKMPPPTVIKVLRKAFALPAPAARLILNDLTRPRKEHRPWIRKVTVKNVWSGCWIGDTVSRLDDTGLHNRIQNADLVIFNVHGGGFRLGSSTMYMDTYISWVQCLKEQYGLNALIMSIDYRLAPEFRYPSPIEDVLKAYEHLTMTLEFDESKIIATGDSAGAALLLEMLYVSHDPSLFEIATEDKQDVSLQKLPRPAGLVLTSPLVTAATTSQSWKDNVEHDFISQYTAKVIKRDYFESAQSDEPSASDQVLGISTLETGFEAFLPPLVLMYVGNKEVLRDDALGLATRAEKDGIQWHTVLEECVHDWFCVREVVKDRSILDRADATFADFCLSALVLSRERKLDDEEWSENSPKEGLDAVLEANMANNQVSTHDPTTETGPLSTTPFTPRKLLSRIYHTKPRATL